MNLDRNNLKLLVQEEIMGLLEAEVPEMPSYAETRAQPEHVPARNVNPPESDYEKLRKQVGAPEGWKVPDSLKHLLEPGAPSFTSGRATVTHEPQQRYANIPGYFGPGEGWPSTAPKSERHPVSNLRKDQYDKVIDPKTGSVDYVKKESTMKLSQNKLKQLVQEELAGLLEQLPAATTTPAGTTPTDPKNKVPTPPTPPPPPGGTAGALAATATGMKALSNVAAATGAAADVQAARGAAALANVPEVSDEEFAALYPAGYKGPLIATESTMKLTRNNLKQLVQEEIMGLLEADPAAALRASLASEEEPKGRGHYLPKEEPEPEPESEEGAPKRQRVVRTRGRGNEPSERELRRAMAANRERLDVPEGKLHRESTMKLTRNDLKQLVQEETGVLLEAPPIDTSQVQQSAKVTQVLRIIDGMKPEDVQSLIQALQQLGLVPPPA